MKKSKSWAALLEQEMKSKEVFPPGEGWYTFEDIKKILGIAECKIRRLIRTRNSAIETFQGRAINSRGGTSIRVWYRLK